jgi:hypothetical protein
MCAIVQRRPKLSKVVYVINCKLFFISLIMLIRSIVIFFLKSNKYLLRGVWLFCGLSSVLSKPSYVTQRNVCAVQTGDFSIVPHIFFKCKENYNIEVWHYFYTNILYLKCIISAADLSKYYIQEVLF